MQFSLVTLKHHKQPSIRYNAAWVLFIDSIENADQDLRWPTICLTGVTFWTFVVQTFSFYVFVFIYLFYFLSVGAVERQEKSGRQLENHWETEISLGQANLSPWVYGTNALATVTVPYHPPWGPGFWSGVSRLFGLELWVNAETFPCTGPRSESCSSLLSEQHENY